MNTLSPELPDVPDSDDLLAAEFVLGLLAAGPRRDAQIRLETDAAFAAHVAAWETYFTPWLEAISPVEVPAALWSRIRTALWQHELPERSAAVLAEAAPSLWNRLSFWRGLAGGGFAVAAVSLAALFVTLNTAAPTSPAVAPEVAVVAPPPTPTPTPVATPVSMVVSMRHDDGTTAYTASIDATTGVITLIPASMPEDARVPELWLIPADGKPRSLGVVARDHAQRVTIPEQLRTEAAANTTFAVSLEPVGGSPSGSPTGPVVASGKLIQL